MCIWNREDIRDERPVDAGGAIVARGAPHAGLVMPFPRREGAGLYVKPLSDAERTTMGWE